jgi:hypothetical protein
LLDRLGEPRCGHVEIDGACPEPPPEAGEASGKDDYQRRDDDR